MKIVYIVYIISKLCCDPLSDYNRYPKVTLNTEAYYLIVYVWTSVEGIQHNAWGKRSVVKAEDDFIAAYSLRRSSRTGDKNIEKSGLIASILEDESE